MCYAYLQIIMSVLHLESDDWWWLTRISSWGITGMNAGYVCGFNNHIVLGFVDVVFDKSDCDRYYQLSLLSIILESADN